jgi:adenosylmethionine-8-amino-7-oxononanoate aminotransferase
VTKEALSRGLLTRVRGGSADPAIGDTICVAPPLMTPEKSIDKIVSIIRDSLIAASK